MRLKTRACYWHDNVEKSSLKLYNNPSANTIKGGNLSPIGNDLAQQIIIQKQLLSSLLGVILSE
jgi:hypothetical protein